MHDFHWRWFLTVRLKNIKIQYPDTNLFIFYFCFYKYLSEGLIHEGDELKEVNGVPLEYKKPKEVLPLLVGDDILFWFFLLKIFCDYLFDFSPQLFVQALFDYSPLEDPTVPCKDAAMAFKRGDVLQIVNMDDDTWWQARSAGNDDSRAGLIPSKQLQERYGFMSSSFKEDNKNTDIFNLLFSLFSAEDLSIFLVFKLLDKTRFDLCLKGPSGVGVNELKRRLVISDPDRYGISVPYTTREKKGQEREGVDYHFVSVHKFEEDILNHRLIEYGSYRGHYYGTSLDSVHRVMVTGKMCLMDVHPSKIKFIDASKFKPHVVFVKPPNIEELRLTRRRVNVSFVIQYGHLFDKIIINGDVTTAFKELKEDLEKLAEPGVQWVPVYYHTVIIDIVYSERLKNSMM
uniref:Membrane protein, palmitoylated 7b (MAGUK p55 subfamily member 7) n=1 Tax=Oryzias latipes TaxID=8090 RepID=A0A3P9J0V0_ORYLA